MTNSIPPEVIASLPESWQVYAGLISAILVTIAAAGRAWHAWKNDSSALKAMVFGINTPATTIAPDQTPTTATTTPPKV